MKFDMKFLHIIVHKINFIIAHEPINLLINILNKYIYSFITSVSILRLGDDIQFRVKLTMLNRGKYLYKMQFTCVAAVGPDGQIGANNNLPWTPASIRGDMNYFKIITSSRVLYSENGTIINVLPAADMVNVVIMGRKTWESIPLKFRPLDSRFNIIITSSKNLAW